MISINHFGLHNNQTQDRSGVHYFNMKNGRLNLYITKKAQAIDGNQTQSGFL
jgi:hypothetical protein